MPPRRKAGRKQHSKATLLAEFMLDLVQSVDDEIESGDPPETRMTLNRLVSEGFDERAARRMIVRVMLDEMNRSAAEDEPFNLARYVEGLMSLPAPTDTPGEPR